MESSVDRLDSGSPNLSNHYPSLENFAEIQTALENGPSNDERSGPPSESSSMVNVSTGTVEKQMTEEVEKNDWSEDNQRPRENSEENWKEERNEATKSMKLEHQMENLKEWENLNVRENPKDPEKQRDTLVVLSDGLPEVVVDRNPPEMKRSKARTRSPTRKAVPPVDSVGGKGVPAEPHGEGLGALSKAVDRMVFALDRCHSGWIGHIERIQAAVHGFLETRHRQIIRCIVLVLVMAYAAYFCLAVWTSVSKAKVLIGITAFVVFVVASLCVSRRFGQRIDSLICAPVRGVTHTRPCVCLKWCLYLTLIIGVILFIVIDICVDTKRLTSLGGMAVFILIGYLTSKNPSKVKWRPVIWGLGLQFILGVIILRWKHGYYFFQFLGDQVRVFLEFADEGSKFVFGEEGYLMHRMAFKVFPIVIYFSAVISIFYYWGLMQFVVCKIAWLMQFTMGTTAIESLNAACNIFIGMAESCVIMRPFLYKLTKSELHAVMTGGFATVAGSYIALLVEVGASPEHLLSAAIMSAPAALAMAKLSYPETEESHTRTEDDVYMENTPARNLVEAASNGAIAAIKVVSSVAANLIAILGLIAFLNKTLEYVGDTVGMKGLSFEMVCSFVFWPLAAIMGVEIQDAGKVASLLGTKIFADEFISFRNLGAMARNGEIAERSTVIATYACCGFGSIAAVGVYIGALISVAPDRRGDISEVALRAVVNGNVAGFLTACIAGILYTGQSLLDYRVFAGNGTTPDFHLLIGNGTTPMASFES